ncbi:pyrroline-5-carboxylate reductase [Treponema phagedenis]|uniref:pyrroline-5-carboxylate reductase n=1 Tax=Treponema phagedenis TaxID=162 RepID=UPI0011EDD951|nr:pyrroline-5-carboxylate reductase [Treponema phagedenis]TYT78742.1 pyrroline-5-carboxylate reductase [Treponema phagedenis]
MNKIERGYMKIGFLGFGNMGFALAQGLVHAKAVDPNDIYALARNREKLQARCNILKITASESMEPLIKESDLIVLAVKPHQIEDIIKPIKAKLKKKVVISIAAGMLFEDYEKILQKGTEHISFLPNTACAIEEGIIIVENRHSLTEEHITEVKNIFGSLGLLEFASAEQFPIAGAISGCGPAYAAMFMEALGDAAVKNGLDRETAYRLAAKMLAGTGMLKLKTDDHPAHMKDAVCSPGGTTIKGLAALEANGFRSAVIQAIDAAMGKNG